MRAKYAGKGPDKLVFTVKNKETTLTMLLGCPMFYNLSATAATDQKDDGRDVVLPSTIAAVNYQLCAGVNVSANYPLAVGDFGEVLVVGYSPFTLLKLRTRATSTDTWASVASIASGLLLVPDFTNNMWQTLANVAAQSAPQNLLVDNIASVASAASNAVLANVSGGVVQGVLVRSFVRML